MLPKEIKEAGVELGLERAAGDHVRRRQGMPDRTRDALLDGARQARAGHLVENGMHHEGGCRNRPDPAARVVGDAGLDEAGMGVDPVPKLAPCPPAAGEQGRIARSGEEVKEAMQEITAGALPKAGARALARRQGEHALRFVRRYLDAAGQTMVCSANWHPAQNFVYCMRIQKLGR